MSVNGIPPDKSFEIQRVQNKKSQESSADRDPNGQASQGGEQEKRKFTEEDIKKAVKKLKEVDGIKSNGLDVHYKKKGYVYVVYVTDMTGQVVRRIPEQDLIPYLQQDDAKPSGHILNKAM